MSTARKASDLSPEQLSQLVMQRRREPAARPAAIPRRQEAGPPPLSFAQLRLWLLDQLDPANPSYSIPFPSWLLGPVAPRHLQVALSEVGRRHESLRTRFPARAGQPAQAIAAPAPVPLPAVDLSALPAAARDEAAERCLDADAARPFDLARGPLFRAALLRLGQERHLLLLNMHHIISDGWSCSVLLGEVSQLYAAYAAGRPSPLPELPIQYADFAQWQRRRLEGEVLAEQLTYWRQKLAGAPPVLELPTDRPRPMLQTNRGETVRHTLPPDLAAGLAELARREGATLFMLLLALWKVLLGRLAGQDDVVVGSPNAGRSRVETEKLIGFFLNEMVLRTELSGGLSVRALLARVQETVLGAWRYQEVPFERLLDEVQPERELSRSPLFQVQLNMLTQPEMHLDLAGAAVKPVGSRKIFAKFDLNLYVQEKADQQVWDLVYNADLFDRTRMEELLRQLEALARQAVADPERPIDQLSLLTAEARALLPDPRRELAAGWAGPVHGRLTLHARAEAGRPAAADEEVSWSWGELEGKANRLAHWLRRQGVGQGDVCAVYAHRSAELAAAVPAALKAGAAFLLLDPAYPPARLVTYLRIARPRGWLALAAAGAPAPEVMAALDEVGCRARLELPADLSGLPETPPEVAVGPGDLACITFTSGSTGEPKGVLGRHGPLSFYQEQWARRFGLGAEDRFGMLSALAHDPLQRDLFTPCWLGARLEIPRPERIGAPGQLAEWALRRRISVLHLTPAMMELLVADAERGDGSGGAPVELPDLRRVFVVGDLLKRSDVARLEAVAPRLQVINLYGSTETQRSVSVYPVPPRRQEDREAIPLGKGLDGMQLLVLNRAGNVAGIGELGEIHARSRHLARGYLDDEALTGQRFLPNPFREETDPPAAAEEAGGPDRLYRTGDLGRYLPGGEVEFAGRVDQQVKIRGFRIELGEVEAALKRHPEVLDGAVLAREDGGGERRLVAYVTPEEAAPAKELYAFLADRLPQYMLPAAFVFLQRLPLTPNGKLDRRALPAPEAPVQAVEDYVPPRTAVEEELAAIWQAWLGCPRVGMQDNFFQLGGHSLLATQVLAAVRDRLGVELPLRTLFEAPTPEGLALAVVEERARRAGDEELARALAEVEGLSEEELDQLLATGPAADGEDEE